MDRRSFLKLALLTSGIAVAGYAGYDLLNMANASVRSMEQQNSGAPLNPGWQVPHLLRRAGFGAAPSELASFLSLGVGGALDELLNYTSIDDGQLPSEPSIPMTFSFKAPPRGDVVTLVWWWLNRMIMTPRPLEEKMTLF